MPFVVREAYLVIPPVVSVRPLNQEEHPSDHVQKEQLIDNAMFHVFIPSAAEGRGEKTQLTNESGTPSMVYKGQCENFVSVPLSRLTTMS